MSKQFERLNNQTNRLHELIKHTKMINYNRSIEQEQRQFQQKNKNRLKNTIAAKKRSPIVQHNYRKAHRLVRFVTKETVAFLFKIEVEQIYRIECWQHVVYVHAEGVSRFVSYADFPPTIAAEKPDRRDFVYWRKRWAKKFKSRIAPEFWVKFYTNKFIEARSQDKLKEWDKLITIFKFLFNKANRERLQENYEYQRFLKKKLERN